MDFNQFWSFRFFSDSLAEINPSRFASSAFQITRTLRSGLLSLTWWT